MKQWINMMACCVFGMLCVSVVQAAAIERWTREDGTKVAWVHLPQLPILDVRIDFDAGLSREALSRLGEASFTLGMLTSGSLQKNEEHIAEKLADHAIQLSTELDEDRAGIRLRAVMGESDDVALALLAELLSQPRFDETVLARKKRQTLDGLRHALTQPASVAAKQLVQAMYGAHPYALGAQLEEAHIHAIEPDGLRAFWRKHYQARFATVTVVGAVSREGADEIAAKLTRGLPYDASVKLATVAVVEPLSMPKMIWRPHYATQAQVMMGRAVLKRHDPDYYALLLGNYILGGGGFDSRLMKQLREQRGLTYGASSSMSPALEAGGFVLSASTKRDAAHETLTQMQTILRTFIEQGVTAAELEQAKNNIVGGFPLRLDSNREVLEYAAVMAFYGLPDDFLRAYPDRIRAVTVSQVNEVLRRRLSGAFVSVVVGGDRDVFATQ